MSVLRQTEHHKQIEIMANHGPERKRVKNDKEIIPKSTMWKRQWILTGAFLKSLSIFLKEFYEKVDFGKRQQTTEKHEKLPSRQ